jgi:hypothetical protein
MPQAPGSLSAKQRDSLESFFTLISGTKVFLESVHPSLQPGDKLLAVSLRDLATLAERKLMEAFPEMHEWLAEWTRGGVR